MPKISAKQLSPFQAIAFPLFFILAFLLLSCIALFKTDEPDPWMHFSVGIGLLIWAGGVFFCFRRKGVCPSFGLVLVRAHYVQALMHTCIFLYWGYYWRNVYQTCHLIIGQILFLYAFDMLLSLTRRRHLHLGFGSIPIVFSTNLFLWFKDDWFVYQYMMIALGALAKEFIRWKRDGESTHIFNPSGFSLSVVSLILILTGTTDLTWGEDVASTLANPPMIYLQIFILGLIVQWLFSVTLVTVMAATMLVILNLIYTKTTGVYYFLDSNIPIAVFLGLHLLITDPATSPRSHLGKAIFGSSYGVLVFLLYGLLGHWDTPQFYDKLLCVPLLNLSVPWIDALGRSKRLNQWNPWPKNWSSGKVNAFYMGLWSCLFFWMVATDFVGHAHQGTSVDFWRQACEEGKPSACEKLLRTLSFYAEQGSPDAANELGVYLVSGELGRVDPESASELFALACSGGLQEGCYNLVNQYLYFDWGDPEDVNYALDVLEASALAGGDSKSAFFIGFSYMQGKGRGLDKQRAMELFGEACELGWRDACVNLAKMHLTGDGTPVDFVKAAEALEKGCNAGDPQSCYILAGLLMEGQGVVKNVAMSRQYLEKACGMGFVEACRVLENLP